MPAKIKTFAESALTDPVTVNVGRAGATNMDIIQVRSQCVHVLVHASLPACKLACLRACVLASRPNTCAATHAL